MALVNPYFPTKRELVSVPDNALNMGVVAIAGKGSGKTTLLSKHAYQVYRKGYPQVLFDPLGTLTPAFLYRTVRFLRHIPSSLHSRFWEQIHYVDLGATDRITPFPLYYHAGTEHSLRDIAVRFLNVLRMSNPALIRQAPISWPVMRRLGVNTGMVLAALGFQLTEAEDLLFNAVAWEKSGRFDEAVRRHPEAAPAVSYFRNQYLSMPRSEKSQRTSLFLDHISDFVLDPQLRLVFCASTPGINWQDVENTGQTVILDFRNITDPEIKRFAMLWVFATLYEFLKQRGRKETPFAVTIDEFAALTQQVDTGQNPLAVKLDELINQYMRNNNIWFTCVFQSLNQLDEQLRNTVLSLGTYVFGRAGGSMAEARVLADALFYRDPYRVKHFRKVWGKDSAYSHLTFNPEGSDYFVIDYEPEFLDLSDQLELAAKKIHQLRLFEFLLRPAIREGEVSRSVIPIGIEHLIRDEATGEAHFSEQTFMDRLRSELAVRSGIPAATILKEQEHRLTSGTPQEQQAPRQQVATFAQRPAAESWEKWQRTIHRTYACYPETCGRARTPQFRGTHSHPTLDEQQRAPLRFLIAHPDTPVSALAKALRIRTEQVAKVRESLKKQGLLQELAVRPAGKGRPLKWLIPTMQAFALLGIDPPAGRGGAVHRQLQQVIAQSATAKGYTAKMEQTLATGAIVDVHLEKGGEGVAVEIAVMSHPSRELSHTRQCLDAGYTKVCTVFADPQLLEKTREALGMVFSDGELPRIQLLPISTLAGIG